DKGCLIFNINKDDSYVVAVVDNTNRTEARYWIDDFLMVKQRQDEYYNTQNILSLCKNFVTKKLPTEFEVNKADQAEILNNSVKYFKENDNFDLEDFPCNVLHRCRGSLHQKVWDAVRHPIPHFFN
ncbi:MAG: nucleoid-associated protein, partial [Alistipes sp.]|nr:nucleoid-associated protein [Alistipes sp.]